MHFNIFCEIYELSKSESESQKFFHKNGHLVHMLLRFLSYSDSDSGFSFRMEHMDRALVS